MAALDNEGRRGLFGERTTGQIIDVNQGTDELVDHIHQLVVERFESEGGPLQYFHVLQGWKTIDLEEARRQLLEHLKEPLRRHRSLEEVTIRDPQLAFTIPGFQIRKPGEPRTSWVMDLSMTLTERKGDGNMTWNRVDNTWAGQKKGVFDTPLSFRVRQLAR